MQQTYHDDARKTIRTFRSKQCGQFKGKLTEGIMTFSGTQNLLQLERKGVKETIEVPDFMLFEAKQIMKRGGGDKMLKFHYLCSVHKAALSACE